MILIINNAELIGNKKPTKGMAAKTEAANVKNNEVIKTTKP